MPESATALFWAFTRIALQGFGGVVAIVQRELVDNRGWLTDQEFTEEWAVAQIMPGPNVVNLAMILGGRYFGWRGAVAGVLGMVCVPTLVVLALAVSFANLVDYPITKDIMRGVSAVRAGLIGGTALRMLSGLRAHALGLKTCLLIAATTLVAVGWLRLPLVMVLVPLALVGFGLTYRVYRREPKP